MFRQQTTPGAFAGSEEHDATSPAAASEWSPRQNQKRWHSRMVTIGVALAVVVALTGPMLPMTASAQSAPTPITATVPVTFSVENTDNPLLPCDKAELDPTHTIEGYLVGPLSALQTSGGTVTVYLHGWGHGRWIWTFDYPNPYDRSSLNFANEMAKLGQTSLVLDRLGYGDNPLADGNYSCLPRQANIAYQVVHHLRAGTYQSPSPPEWTPPKFSRVALAGLSAGAAITEMEAYSFGEVDAIALFSWSDDVMSQGTLPVLDAFNPTMVVECLTGGNRTSNAPGPNYAYFGRPSVASGTLDGTADSPPLAGFWEINFSSFSNNNVVNAAFTNQHLDPCGDVYSALNTFALNTDQVKNISVPVLLMYGANDQTFWMTRHQYVSANGTTVMLPAAPDAQRALFRGSKDVTLVTPLPKSGHLLPLEPSAPLFRSTLANWLRDHKFT
jgi:pimeloyl-ACP methyl ester carboxylesterase